MTLYKGCCRVCLFKNDIVGTLFNNTGNVKAKTFADMLNIITDIKVTVNDGLPDKICKICSRNLELAYSFIVLAQSSDKKLQACSKEPKKKLNFNSITDIKKELNSLSVKKEKKKFVFDSISDIKLEGLNFKKETKCNSNVDKIVRKRTGNGGVIANTTIKKICNKNQATKKIKIEGETIKIEISDDDDDGKNSDDNFFRDDLNNDPDYCPSDDDADKPTVKAKPVQSPAKIGDVSIKGKPNLQIKKILSKLYVNSSTIVKQVVNNKAKGPKEQNVERPLKINKAAIIRTKIVDRPDKPSYERMVCPSCGILTYQLEKHMITHEEKAFKCQICQKEFHKQTQLEEHMRYHTGERAFMCAECGQGFFSSRALASHTAAVHENKGVECSICSKKFRNKNTLRNHLDTHENIKRHSCSVCGMAFRRHHHLKAHMVTHTGERCYSCEICGMDFPYRINLNNHVLRDHNVDIKGRRVLKFTVELLRKEMDKIEEAIMANKILGESEVTIECTEMTEPVDNSIMI